MWSKRVSGGRNGGQFVSLTAGRTKGKLSRERQRQQRQLGIGPRRTLKFQRRAPEAGAGEAADQRRSATRRSLEAEGSRRCGRKEGWKGARRPGFPGAAIDCLACVAGGAPVADARCGYLLHHQRGWTPTAQTLDCTITITTTITSRHQTVRSLHLPTTQRRLI